MQELRSGDVSSGPAAAHGSVLAIESESTASADASDRDDTDTGHTCCFVNAATCPDCGSGMVRLGACFSCPLCGYGTCGG